jgi:hypothetical protein
MSRSGGNGHRQDGQTTSMTEGRSSSRWRGSYEGVSSRERHRFDRPRVWRFEHTVAHRATEVSHDTLQHRGVNRSVIDDVGQELMLQIGVHASVDGPVGIGLRDELRAQKTPGYGV